LLQTIDQLQRNSETGDK